MVDSLIRIYNSYETNFNTVGLGTLPDAASCEVSEERNSSFELEMKYPVNGVNFNYIQLRAIIVAKPNPYDAPQPFRIYEITKPIDGLVTINAQHISYDLSGYPVSPFSADGALNAMLGLKTHCPVDCPFYFSTDKATASRYNQKTPSSIRSQLGGVEGSILDIYGGEYEFNGWNVILHDDRGEDRGVEISYGKNLTDFEQTEDGTNLYTGIYPYWYSNESEDSEAVLVTLPEKIVKVEGDFDYENILPVNFSDSFQEAPSISQLRSKARAYVKSNSIGKTSISISVGFYSLSNSEEFSDLALLETVKLCDIVTVNFPLYGVKKSLKCISTKYNVLDGKYIEIELGSKTSTLSSQIASHEESISEVITKTEVDRSIENATKLISGGAGGYVVIRNSLGGKEPDEILVMDTNDVNTATKVWRWNKNGLGFSSTGYSGTYNLAATIDGSIVADFITSGKLQTERLIVGSITTDYLTSEVAEFIQNGNLWLKFDQSLDGLVIGKQNSKFTVNITNAAILFKEDGTVIASITNKKLTIKDGEFTNTLQIGKTNNQVFSFIPRSNGTLDFKYTGIVE